MGISHRRWEGWEPTTVYAHDDAGRLISSTPESEWDETEQAKMLALALYRDSRCPGCGGDLQDTTAAEHEDRYRPELPVQCYRCVAFSQSHKAYADQPHATSFIHLVPQVPR